MEEQVDKSIKIEDICQFLDQESKACADELVSLKAASKGLRKRIDDSTKLQELLTKSLEQAQLTQDKIGPKITEIEGIITTLREQKVAYDAQKTDADTAYTNLTSQQSNVLGQVNAIKSAFDEISNFRSSLLDDSLENGKLSIKSEIGKSHDEYKAKVGEIEEFIKEIRQQFVDLKKNLTGEIHSLLLSAGAAGLAGAYYDAKVRYGFDADPSQSFWRKIFNFNIIKTLFNYVLFIAPIITVYVTFYESFKDFNIMQ